jgi:uncharacterized protein
MSHGPTDTEFLRRAGMEDTRVAQEDKDDPAEAAAIGFKAMMRGDADVVSGWKNKLRPAVVSITPSTVLAEMHRRWSEPGSDELSEPIRRGTEEEIPWPLKSRNN